MMKEYKRMLSWGEKAKRPLVKQALLMMACCSYQIRFFTYGTLIPCSTCEDGSCDTCQLTCLFDYMINNYNDVKMVHLEKERPSSIPTQIYNTCKYLNSVTSLKQDNVYDVTTTYTQL